MVKNVAKRTASLLLVFLLVVSLLPAVTVPAFAESSGEVTGLSNENIGLSYNGDKTDTWSASGTTITGSIQSSSGCGTTHYESTLTITNKRSIPATLSFDYAIDLQDGTITVGGTTVSAGGSFSKELQAGGTVGVYIKSNSTSAPTKITLSNVALSATVEATVTFLPAENGSYTVDGQAVAEEFSKTQNAMVPYALVATPASGYQFRGWYNETTGEYLGTDATLTLNAESDCTIVATFLPESANLFEAGTQTFEDLGDAAAYAREKQIPLVTLLSKKATLTKDCTIPAGVTLLIPHDAAKTLFLDSPTALSGNLALSGKNNEYKRLTLAEGVTLTIQGALSVGGQYRSCSGSSAGYMTGNYGQVWLNSGSCITVENDGKLYAWGFVSGEGTVTVRSGGTAYEWYQITDFRGGSATMGMGNRVFPFSQYYVQNIESALTLEQGASEKAYAAVYAQSRIYYSMIPFVDNSGMFKVVSGSLTKRYDGASDRMIYTVNGQAEVNNLSLKLAGSSVNSKNYVLPLTNNMTVELAEKSKLTINQTAALLPGVYVQIARDAELVISGSNSIYVYDRDEWIANNYTCLGKFSSVQYSPSKTYNRTDTDLVDAKIDVNGNITVNGAMYTTEHGADICSSAGTGVFQQNSAPGTETVTYQYTQSGTSVTDHKIPITPAKLHNDTAYYSESLEYTETATAKSGDTINYILGMWGGTPATVTFNANGGDGTMDVQKITSFNTPLKDCAFTRLGYTFAGWKDSDENTYKNGETVSLTSGSELALTAQWTENTYTITVKSDASGSPIADVSLDGPGTGYKITEWSGDKQITIIAPEKQGFTFKGWYKSGSDYSEAAWNTDLVVKKSLTELLAAGMADENSKLISLVAVYTPATAADLTLKLVNAPSVTVNGGGTENTNGTWSVPVGAEVTINASNVPGFQYWTNANDKVMSKDPTYTFTMVTNTTLTAETNDSGTFVIFQSADERLLKAEAYSENLTLPDAPYRVGYTFAGWKVNGSTDAATQDLETLKSTIDALSNKANVVVTAEYTDANSESFTVTATANVSGANIEGSKKSYKLGEIATFEAPAESGNKAFRFWASDVNGANILSFSTTYSFRVTQKTDIYAIYGGENKPEVQPVVRVDNVLAGNENSANSLTFMIGASIPKDYQLVEMGALYARTETSGTDAQLRVENVSSTDGVYKAVSRLKPVKDLTDYSYALGFNMANNPNTTIYLRGYVAVKKTNDDTIYYYYSGVTSAKYDTVNGG